MKIRPATEADSPALAPLAQQLGYPTSIDEMPARLAGLRDRLDHAVLVAKQDGAVLGWVHVFGAERIESEPFAEIGGLVVDATQRSGGLGAALVEAAEQRARAHGYGVMRVRSNVVRENAHRFYETHGYECTKHQAVFVKHKTRAGGRA